ncbi:hypothetical protein BgiBS90_006160 [Biomphalaria glabrata]|nr:hypothetical protein BgiBS90_006160 [Biomphalaria glabrata]
MELKGHRKGSNGAQRTSYRKQWSSKDIVLEAMELKGHRKGSNGAQRTSSWKQWSSKDIVQEAMELKENNNVEFSAYILNDF